MISSPCMICWHDDLWPNAGCLRLFHQNLRTKWLTSQHFTKVNLQCGLYCAQYTCCSSIWTARQLVHQTSYPSVTVQRHVVLPCLSRDWPTGWQKSSPWPTNRLDNQPPTVTCHSIPRGVFHPHGHNLEAYLHCSYLDITVYPSRFFKVNIMCHLQTTFQLARWVGSLWQGLSRC